MWGRSKVGSIWSRSMGASGSISARSADDSGSGADRRQLRGRDGGSRDMFARRPSSRQAQYNPQGCLHRRCRPGFRAHGHELAVVAVVRRERGPRDGGARAGAAGPRGGPGAEVGKEVEGGPARRRLWPGPGGPQRGGAASPARGDLCTSLPTTRRGESSSPLSVTLPESECIARESTSGMMALSGSLHLSFAGPKLRGA